MKLVTLADDSAVARRGAAFIAQAAREAIAARGRCIVAVSGGATPLAMLRVLARERIPWRHVDIVQVDERAAPTGSAGRNLTHLQDILAESSAFASMRIHAMPVESADLEQGALDYARTLEELAGAPPVLDLVQLGLGADGHTASLVPGDPVLEIGDREVAVTGEYRGHRRMTLTYPALNRARSVLWLVTGAAKAEVLARFDRMDCALPACGVRRGGAVVIADAAAAAQVARAQLSAGGSR